MHGLNGAASGRKRDLHRELLASAFLGGLHRGLASIS
jgi:hypothetical protein